MISDQAQRLRQYLLEKNAPPRPTRVITVTSGKGGVGKSNFTLNFALSLIQKGQKVVLLDLDLGMANLDILMGLTPRYHLFDMIDKEKKIRDIIEKGPEGLEYIAGGSGFQDIMELDEVRLKRFFDQLGELHGYADTVLLDTGAGLSKESVRFILAADEVVLLTTPEPTAITDAYAVMKILQAKDSGVRYRLVVNRVSSRQEGRQIADKIQSAAREFLRVNMDVLGFIPDDPQVMQAVKKQVPFYLAHPGSSASKAVKELVETFLTGAPVRSEPHSGMKGFIQKLFKFRNQG